MSLFSSRGDSKNVGLLIEVGSGSVLAAMVVSDATQTHPDIVWSKREYVQFQSDARPDHHIKGLMTALVNTVMECESSGQKALSSKYGSLPVSTIQAAIAAPWAYTISKVIEYERETPFTITETLIEALIKSANEQTVAVLKESEQANQIGLTIMTRATTDITANGYHTMSPLGQTATTISLTQVSGMAQSLITTAINDLRSKLFPKAFLERYTTMLIFHSTIKELYPSMTEYCLVDLSYEATEIAIIRDGVLQYSTHNAIGMNTIVRNIALRLDRPLADAESILKTILDRDSIDSVTTRERAAIADILTEYETALESLFHETGDSLSIPKVLFLHANFIEERFFDNIIASGARKATNSQHTVHTVTHDLVLSAYRGESKIEMLQKGIDTGILMAGQFFHKVDNRDTFTQV